MSEWTYVSRLDLHICPDFGPRQLGSCMAITAAHAGLVLNVMVGCGGD